MFILSDDLDIKISMNKNKLMLLIAVYCVVWLPNEYCLIITLFTNTNVMLCLILTLQTS